MRELVQQAINLLNQAIAGLPADSPAPTVASPAKSQLQSQPAPVINVSADHDMAKLLVLIGLAEQELDKLDAGAPGQRIRARLKDAATAGKWPKIKDAITAAIGELEFVSGASALEAKLNQINELVSQHGSDVTAGGTDVTGDMEGQV